MTEVNSRKRGEIFEVIIKTDNEEYCKAVENFCLRQMVCAKPMTNGDRIRAMSDEELIEKIYKHVNCKSCPARMACVTARACKETWLNWLKQPAEVEHDPKT